MPQVTIYLDDKLLTIVNSAVKAAGVSKSQWIAAAIRARAAKEWPESVRSLPGSWPDFPTAEEIRKRRAKDVPRERL